MCKEKTSILNSNNLLLTGSMILIMIGIIVHLQIPEEHFFWGKLFPLFVSELGIAGIIAVALMVTIERRSKELEIEDDANRMDALGENVLSAVYKRNIQDSVFALIEDSVLKATVCRENYRVRYTITRIDPKVDAAIDKFTHVKCHVRISYDLINMTKEPQDHVISMCFERPYDNDWDEDDIGLESLTVTQGGKSQELTDKVDDNINQRQALFTHTITLQNEETVSVKSSANLIKRSEDNETWASLLPADGIELSINVPSGDLEVFAVSQHPKPLDPVEEGPLNWEWMLDSGIFPYQSIIFWWKPKEKKGGNINSKIEKPDKIQEDTRSSEERD